MVVKKSDNSDRLCTNFCRLNKASCTDSFPMPRVEDLIDKVGRAKFLSKLYMSKDFWQVPLDEDSIPLTGFVIPNVHYQWKFMSFGLNGVPATFAKLGIILVRGIQDFCDIVFDDLIVFSGSWLDWIMLNIFEILARAKSAKLTLNPKKCSFANAEVDFLGHHWL